MQRIIVFIGIGLLISSLNGCSYLEDSGLKPSTQTNQVSSGTDTDIALSDGGIAAPTTPTLSISATPGALNFKWVDWRTNVNTITNTTLFEYNSRTEQEIELSTTIEPGNLRFTLPIQPHRLAWDANSYRVEICSNDNCVSSLRVPVRTLLPFAITAVTPSDVDISPSFGDDLALNATGNVAVASSPTSSSAAVLLNNDQQWVQASTLTSDHFSMATDSDMRVAVSANGDTVAIASMSSTTNPIIVIFDRLGENWIETAAFTPFEPLAITQLWDTGSLSLQISDDGDRLAFAAQHTHQSFNIFDDRNNQILVFDRSTITWTRSAKLVIPQQQSRLRSTSTSGSINKIVALSTLNNSLYLHEFSLLNGQWLQESSQILDTISPSIDTQIVSSHDAAHVVLAAWELESDLRRSAVARKLAKSAAGWIAVDSIRMPPTADQSATLRLASDADLQSLAIGWQAQVDANVAFYAESDERWQHLFSVPAALNLNRRVAMAQSIAVSADNSTVLIGTTQTDSGGVLSSFR